MYYWSLAWRILSITFLACAAAAAKLLQSCSTLCDPIDCSPPGSPIPSVWDECNCAVVWSLYLGLKWKHLFQSCGHCWGFQICWHIECSTFTASSFRIWNSATGIPSPPLALFVVMLPKAPLTSHSRMSGSRWVITPLWSLYLGHEDLSSFGLVNKAEVDVFLELSCFFNDPTDVGNLISGSSGKGQFSFLSQRKAMPKNVQTTAQLHSSHTLAK